MKANPRNIKLRAPMNPTPLDAAAVSDLLTAVEALRNETSEPFALWAVDGMWRLSVRDEPFAKAGLRDARRPFDREGVLACREALEDGSFDWPWTAPTRGLPVVTRDKLRS